MSTSGECPQCKKPVGIAQIASTRQRWHITCGLGLQANPTAKDLPATLTADEKVRFEEQHAIVRDKLLDFVELGRALIVIKTEKLYRETHGTFKGYLRVEHDIDDSNGYRLMLASGVVDQLKTRSIDRVPANVEQCRPLLNVHEDDLPEVRQGVLDRAESEDVPVTSTLIRSFVKAIVSAV